MLANNENWNIKHLYDVDYQCKTETQSTYMMLMIKNGKL